MTEKRYKCVCMTEDSVELQDNRIYKVFNDVGLEHLLNKQEEDYINAIRAWKELDDKHKELKEENEQLKDDVYNEIDNTLTVLKELYEDTPLNSQKKINQLYNRLESLREEMK